MGSDISVFGLKKMLECKADFLLLDCRTQKERDFAKIQGSVLIPVQELSLRLKELDRKKEIVVYCHTGGRSRLVVSLLNRSGFSAKNLVGGIDAWSAQVDLGVPRY